MAHGGTGEVLAGGLTRLLADTGSVAGVLHRVVLAASRLVPDTDLVCVTLRAPDGYLHTPTETGPEAAELDRVQFETGEGPCVDAADPGGPGYAYGDRLGGDGAWPTFGKVAAAYGYAAVLCTALLPGRGCARVTGALSVYSRRRGAFGTPDVQGSALLLATHAALALDRTRAVTDGQLREVTPGRGLSGRDVLTQATRILVARRGLEPAAAFARLYGTAAALDERLPDLAVTLALRQADL